MQHKLLNPPARRQVRSDTAQAYLWLHGGKPLPPEQPHLLCFERLNNYARKGK